MAELCTLTGILIAPDGAPFGAAKVVVRPVSTQPSVTMGGAVVAAVAATAVETDEDGAVTLVLAPGSYRGSATQGAGGRSCSFDLAVPDLETAPLGDYIGAIDVVVQTSAQLARDQAVQAAEDAQGFATSAGSSAGNAVAQATLAAGEVTLARAARDQAEVYRDAAAAAALAVGVFGSTAAGLLETGADQTFWVTEGGQYLRLWQNVDGVAVDLAVRLAQASLTNGLRQVDDPPAYAGAHGIDRAGWSAVSILPSGDVLLRRVGEVWIEEPPTVNDPFVWGKVGPGGFVVLGVRRSGIAYGNFPADGNSGGGSALPRDAVLGMDHANVWSAEVRSATTRRFMSDTEGSVRAYIQRTDIVSFTCVLEDNVLHVNIKYGQSLGVGGSKSPPDAPYSTVPRYPYQALMLNTGTVGSGSTVAWVPDAAFDLVSAVEALHGTANSQSESPVTGMLDRMVMLDAAAGSRKRVYCGHSAGAGGQDIDALAVGSQPWLNMIAALDRIIAIAARYEMRVVVDGFSLTHGESNAATEVAVYRPKVEFIVDAFRTICQGRGVLPAITLPVGAVHTGYLPFFMDMVSSPAGNANGRTPNIAFLEIEANDPLAFVSTAKYHLKLSDTLHLRAPDYRIMGEHEAKAHHAVRETGAWTGCRITGAVLAGSTISLAVHVPVGDLVVDTTTVPAVAHYGLRYEDDASSVSIASVSIGETVDLACTITVTLTGAPSGGAPRISYAYSAVAPLAAPNFGAVGNLRDSDPMVSTVPAEVAGNGFLQNWLLVCPPINL